LGDYVADLTSGVGADAAVDGVGNQFAICLDLVTRGGIVSLFGMNAPANPAIPQCVRILSVTSSKSIRTITKHCTEE